MALGSIRRVLDSAFKTHPKILMRHKTIIHDLTTFRLISIQGSTSGFRLITFIILSQISIHLLWILTYKILVPPFLKLMIRRLFCACVLEAMIITMLIWRNRLYNQTQISNTHHLTSMQDRVLPIPLRCLKVKESDNFDKVTGKDAI